MAQQQPFGKPNNISRTKSLYNTNNTIKRNDFERAVRATSYMHRFNKNHGRMGQHNCGFKVNGTLVQPSKLSTSPITRKNIVISQNNQNTGNQSVSKLPESA
eukprot:UN02164